METIVRLDGAAEAILEELVKKSFYKTKSEAIRAGILELGREYIPKSEFEGKLISEKKKEDRCADKERKSQIGDLGGNGKEDR
ncbi:MAG: hypothetical protein KGH61_00985 [Candidatus Micrarchaeota archaeon]|nr:hypothetical protein [Candidatus Micrarchaeota archaeon]MDE1847509.1 hypothetical protein [Candidatus Micrarchaeota archaeon]MDE1863855.1 hypothetical protein [Candidatus Micrarchaeota archaeon]